MKKFRLKKEATVYFKEDHAASIYPLGTWEKLGVDINALDEVKEPYIDYGIQTSESCKNMCGWDKNGTEFHFTICFPSVGMHEHDKFSKGRIVRELMNKIQNNIDDFYDNFTTNTD